MAEGGLEGGVASPRRVEVKWHLVIWKLWKEVKRCVERSHGPESEMAREVGAWGGQIGQGLEDFERSESKARADEMMGREWATLMETNQGVEIA